MTDDKEQKPIRPGVVEALVDAMTTSPAEPLRPEDQERLLKRAAEMGTVPSPPGLGEKEQPMMCSGYAGPDTSEPWKQPPWWRTLVEFLRELRETIAEAWDEAEYHAGLKARHRRARRK